MARGKKLPAKEIAATVSYKIENPEASLREIENETGVNRMTASRILENELWQIVTKSEIVQTLVDINVQIINESKRKLLKFVERAPVETWSDAKQVSTIAKEALEQKNLLTGEATDNSSITIKWES